MDNLISALPVLIALLVTALWWWYYYYYSSSIRKNTIPEPRGWWPIVGHLFSVGPCLPNTFTAWYHQLGPVYSLRLGQKKVVVISGVKAFRQAFEERPGRNASSGRTCDRSHTMMHYMDGAWNPLVSYLKQASMSDSERQDLITKHPIRWYQLVAAWWLRSTTDTTDTANKNFPMGMLFADDGPSVSALRAWTHQAMAQPSLYRNALEKEVTFFMQTMKDNQSNNWNVRNLFHHLGINVISVLALGKRTFEQGCNGAAAVDDGDSSSSSSNSLPLLFKILEEMVNLNDGNYLSDYFWFLPNADRKRHTHLLELAFQKKKMIGDIVKEHQSQLQSEATDMIDSLLIKLQQQQPYVIDSVLTEENNREQFVLNYVTAAVAEIFAAGNHTMSHSLEWLLCYLSIHPSYQSAIYDELKTFFEDADAVAGDALPLQSFENAYKHDQFPWLTACICEMQRLVVLVPFWLPRKTVAPLQVGDYVIPAEMPLFPNFQSVCRDPGLFGDDLESFRPDRFLKEDDDNNNNKKKKKYSIAPHRAEGVKIMQRYIFGAGARSCPGQKLGTLQVAYVLATFIYGYQIQVPTGVDVQTDYLNKKMYGVVTKMEPDPILQLVPRW